MAVSLWEQFMVQAGDDAGGVQVDRRTAAGSAAPISRSDIVMLDAIALAGAIRSRRASCVEVMTAYLDHIDQLNPKVNAIVALQDREGLLV
jgi:amidase